MTERLPWEVVETFPSTDAETVARWERHLRQACSPQEIVRSKIGLALVLYWAVQEGVEDDFEAVAGRRRLLTREALDSARRSGDPKLVVEALLGALYANWGPQTLVSRRRAIAELVRLRQEVDDEELRFRIDEWAVIDAFDRGALDEARRRTDEFQIAAAQTELVLFRRRSELWKANLAMLLGRIDRAVAINQGAVADTSDTAGTPFSFQNVAITVAIERFLRRELGDVVEAIGSILASSPRVSVNWTVGLAFSLSESGATEDARTVYEPIAADDFAVVPKDLNWLVTTQLLALIALRIGDDERWPLLLEQLRPFAELDGTHGCGYASYGPVGRTVGLLAARTGRHEEAIQHFERVLATRHPGPWTSLTRLDRALAFQESDPASALADASLAASELRALGMDRWAQVAARLELDLAVHGGRGTATAQGEHWLLRHPEGDAVLRDGVGIRLLLELLVRPGEALDTATLTGAAEDSTASTDSGSTTMRTLDPAAEAAYRQRIQELDSIPNRQSAEDQELAFLRRELAGGRFAPAVSAEQERARVRVTKAIHRTIAAVADQSATLGDHLRQSVETGRRCSYAPPDGRAWTVVRPPPVGR